MMKTVKHIYSMSPVFIQNVFISVYGHYWKNRRMGKLFSKERSNFMLRESFSKENWKDYQTKELRKLLVHAFKTVPFYTDKYKSTGFRLEDFEKFEMSDLSKLPFLEKEDLRKFGNTTLLSTQKKKGKFYSSSGSTGTPISVYFSKEFHQTWNAVYETRVRNWAGVNYKMRRGMIGGRRILPKSDAKPPFYRYNYAEKQTYFSAYHLSEKTVENYLEGLRKHQVEYLVGYAMSIFIMADLVLKLKLNSPKLVAVLTSSEKLTNEMRSTISKVFKCSVFDAYSGMEACGLISENAHGDFLFSPDTGIMEVVDESGVQVSNGDSGEVIATGLLNFDQPLIRYRIGDRVKISKDQSSSMPIVDEIEGRVEDIIIGTDGQKMVRFHAVFLDIEHLRVSQVMQVSRDEIQVNLVVSDGFDRSNEVVLVQRIKSQLGEILVSFRYLDSIPKEKNGKFKAVISNFKNSIDD